MSDELYNGAEWHACWCGYGTNSERKYQDHGDKHMAELAKKDAEIAQWREALREVLAVTTTPNVSNDRHNNAFFHAERMLASEALGHATREG